MSIPFRVKERSWIAWLAAKKLGTENMAIVLGNTVHLFNRSKQEFLSDDRWLRHELCHVKQFREYGVLPFIFKYLWESFRHGYYNNRFEAEAREAEKK